MLLLILNALLKGVKSAAGTAGLVYRFTGPVEVLLFSFPENLLYNFMY